MPGTDELVRQRLLLATDLDGTLIPDGRYSESPNARRRFAQVVGRPEVTLAYVTGRHRELVEEAISEFSLPQPDLVIADVGTTIYETAAGTWIESARWRATLRLDWSEPTRERVAVLLRGLASLDPQEESRQNDFKLSYYLEGNIEARVVLSQIERRLEVENLAARLIFSRDSEGVGLLDVLPTGASKLSAIEFVAEQGGLRPAFTVFSGDSGNDLEVLSSPFPATLVANATAAVRHRARQLAEAKGNAENLYLARGGLLGMNGNYAAGILEGLAHFVPETVDWMT